MKSEKFATARLASLSTPSECFSDSAKLPHLKTSISVSFRFLHVLPTASRSSLFHMATQNNYTPKQ